MAEKVDEHFRAWRFATKAIHPLAKVRDDAAVSDTLIMSTNFHSRPGAQRFSGSAVQGDAASFYARWSTPNVLDLEAKLAVLEGAEGALCFASGMAAAAALLLGTLRAGDHLLYSDVCYAGVAELARTILPNYGIACSSANFSDPAAVAEALRPNTRLLWAETPSNPILRLTDLSAVARLAAAAGAKLAVDSTLATPLATRPVEFGATWVVHSLTKYLNGHGDALGGVVLGPKVELAALRRDALIHFGGALSPFNAWLIDRGLHTLALRMAQHTRAATRVATFLEQHPAVSRVIYPGLASHPQYELACRQMAIASGMLTFQLKGDAPRGAERLATRLKVFSYAVSLGAQRSLIYFMDSRELLEDSFRLDGKAREDFHAFAGDGILRTSIGLEDPDDLCEDLGRALDGWSAKA